MDMNTQQQHSQQPPQPYTQAPSPQLQQNNISQQQNKPKHNNNNQKFNSSDVGGSKAPPVPTLVRQPGSNLVGLKPTHLPDEVVKNNQASERAKLLQSLSGFFPGQEEKKSSPTDSSQDGTDWATKAANSSPLPPRKPGMRHPGVEKLRKPEDKRQHPNKNRGPPRQNQNKKQHQQPPAIMHQQQQPMNDNKPTPTLAQTAPSSASDLNKSVKKLTLADTKPKKGEVSTIKLN